MPAQTADFETFYTISVAKTIIAKKPHMIYTHFMPIFLIILLIILFIIVSGGVFSFFYCRGIAKKVYNDMLVRTTPDKWGRRCSAPENEEHLEMWNRGCAWADEHKDCMQEVTVTNDGLKLCGEYYDFGFDRSVIIIPGRSESLMYSYYFAIPYYKAGCNILVIDIRSHGNSEGKYNYVCNGEDGDILCWAKLLHDRFGCENVILHGICIGAGTCVLLAARDDCPDYIKAIISEGGYISFPETFRRHMNQIHKPVFPVMPMVMHELKKHTGTNVYKSRPIDFIDRVRVPYLFLCGKKDLSSLPECSQMLYDRCGSKDKSIIWFEEGAHSHLRIADEDAYDRAVSEFIQRRFG